jgi:hypothetical protein
LKKLVLTLALLTAGTSLAVGQARPAASRLGDLQVGATYSVANPDLGVTYIRGFGAYSDFDFLRHIGVEVDFRQLNDPDDSPTNRFFQRSYEVGGRYFWRFGNLKPYGKALYGRGQFSSPSALIQDQLEAGEPAYPLIATNMIDFGIGADFAVQSHINIRVEGEYQKWFSSHYPLGNGLTPTMVNFGVAYHFPPGKPRR